MAATVTLPALLALYKLDREIHGHEVALEMALREQKKQQGKIADLTKSADAQDLAAKKVQADINVRDLELKTKQAHIEKMRESLNATKTNKEYSAILVQISAEKDAVAKLETATLELMQQVETANKAIGELRKQIETEKQGLAKIEAEHAEKVAGLQSQIAGLKGQRGEAAKAVQGEALRQYERVSQKYPGDALAPIDYQEDDLETASCGSCYMGLSVEHINALRGRGEIRRCDSCNRILYLPEMMVAGSVGNK